MTTAQSDTREADPGLPPDLFDAVAFEARLAAARLRRHAVVVGRTPAARDVRPPALVIDAAAPPRPARTLPLPWAFAAMGVAAFAAALAVLGLRSPEVPAPLAFSDLAVPEPVGQAALPAPAVVALLPLPVVPAKVSAALPLFPSGSGPAGPSRRPGDFRVGAPAPAAVRSARNAPHDSVTPPEAVGLIVRDLNAATIGRVAGALGIRGRKAVPGVPVTVRIDRRGLGFDARRQAKRR